MELRISGKNIELKPEVQQYIEKKLGKLNRHLPEIVEAKVEVSEEKTKSRQQRYIAQVTVDSSGILLRGEERGEDLFIAIDKVTEIMERQVERYKGRRQPKKGSLTVRAEAAETVLPKVVKNKHFAVKSLSVEEAEDQMELLGHDFFLFRNSDSNGLNLLYRRKDGNYGLIETDFE